MDYIMTTLSGAMAMLNSLCGEGLRFDNPNQMADFLGLDPQEKPGFYKILKGTTRPRADRLLDWLDKLGFVLTPPWEVPTVCADDRESSEKKALEVMDALRSHGVDERVIFEVSDIVRGVEHRAAAGSE